MNNKTTWRVSQQYQLYAEEGFLAFPTLGNNAPDAEGVKVPAIKSWSTLTGPLSDSAIARHLFLGNDGIALLCGNGLAVLDFDDESHFQGLMVDFPELQDTVINLSGRRHLPHVYFTYPKRIALKTQHIQGIVDLQAQGAYVITPPTEAHGLKWERKSGKLRHIVPLKPKRLDELQEWLNALKTPKANPVEVVHGDPIDDLVGLYEALRDQHASRNIGYFLGLLHAQASGQRQQFIDTVRDVFVEDDTNKYEHPSSRLSEARRVEDSATRYQISTGKRQVPYMLPERLCQSMFELGGIVLFTLWALGIEEESLATQEIISLVKAHTSLSRRSIATGLSELIHDDFISIITAYYSSISTMYRGSKFALSDDPYSLDPISLNHSMDLISPLETLYDEHTMYRGSKFALSSEHGRRYIPKRPEGVMLLQAWALNSRKAFRLGTLLDLIANHPGEYSREELSDRTGMTVSTVKRYLRELREGNLVETQSAVKSVTITWDNLAELVKDRKLRSYTGRWLQDSEGKVYPPIRDLAARLLSEGKTIFLVKQLPNRYQVKE